VDVRPLPLDDNTQETFEINRRQILTSRQAKDFTFTRQNQYVSFRFFPIASLGIGFLIGRLTYQVCFILGFVRNQNQWVNAVIFSFSVGMIVFIVLFRLWQKRPRIPNLVSDVVRPDIAQLIGKPTYEIDPSHHSPGYVLRLDGRTFAVSRNLWESLRDQPREMHLHYLDWNKPMLLSIQPYELPKPPTDEDLKEAVGMGEDGEIVYGEMRVAGDER
jgi:hypothetical protein